MQNTRLNSLLVVGAARFSQWLSNPWRKLSVLILSLLFGFFLANVISTTTGQTADLDILVSGLLLATVEAISFFVYRRRRTQIEPTELSPVNVSRSTRPIHFLDLANGLKIGLIYGLFLEAFKLGS